jgi:hypothetical protein
MKWDFNLFGGREVETEVRKWLRQQSKDFHAAGFDATGEAMGEVYQCWWRICQEINVFFFPGLNITYFTFYINL